MKPFSRFYILISLLVFAGLGLDAQICLNISVHLNEQGTYTLNPYQVVSPDLAPEYEPIITRSFFTCENLGPNAVNVYILLEEDTVFSCIANVEVLDFEPPTSLCHNTLNIVLGNNGAHTFSFDELDNGSNNLCDNFGYMIHPPAVQCGDPNPLSVMLVLLDYSGNYDTCITTVTWEEDPTPAPPLVCPDAITVEVFEGPAHTHEYVLITADMIFPIDPYGCPEHYMVELWEGGVLRPDPIVTYLDIDSTLLLIITDIQSSEQCSIDVFIEGVPGCEVTFFICDTLCRGVPLGDCDSGHTDQDGIEWPCDIMVNGICPLTVNIPEPDDILWFHLADHADAYPTGIPPGCNSEVFLGWWDEVFYNNTHTQVLRHWTVLHWTLEETWEYEQEIILSYDLTEICDTLPWNAPAGDCDSGHTLSDDVEWPADITIHVNFPHPDDLALNPDVLPQNVRPQLNAECKVANYSFHDLIFQVNDTTILVERLWIVVDSYSEEEWQYTQRITIKKDAEGSIVCITREAGDPLQGVELIPGIVTNESGCYIFDDPEGIIVTPAKDSPIHEGVNVLDLIMVMEYLLGQRPFSDFQKLAGDVNHSSGMSAIDFVELKKLIIETLLPPFPKVWRFYELVTWAGSADISDPSQSYKFIGVKTGDVNNSYSPLGPPDYDDIYLKVEDEILNNGETYQIPVYLSEEQSISGFAVKILTPNLEILNVSAPGLPVFSNEDDVTYGSGSATILWVAPGLSLQQGVSITPDSPFFMLEIKANANVILHEELTLEITFDNLLKSAGDNPAFDVRFEWENVIISSIVNLDQGRTFTFYPNPVRDQVYIKGITDKDQGKVRILDTSGRLVFTSSLQPVIQLSQLTDGLYYATIIMEDGETAMVPLYKTR